VARPVVSALQGPEPPGPGDLDDGNSGSDRILVILQEGLLLSDDGMAFLKGLVVSRLIPSSVFTVSRVAHLLSPSDAMYEVRCQAPDVSAGELHKDGEYCRENGSCVGRDRDGGPDHTALGPVDPEARVDIASRDSHGDETSSASTLAAMRYRYVGKESGC